MTLLKDLSPELQGLATAHCYSAYVYSVPFFVPDNSKLTGYTRMKADEETTIFLTQVWLGHVGQ